MGEVMKRFFDIFIVLGLIGLVVFANKEFFGSSFKEEKLENINFDSKNQVTQFLFSSELAPDISGFGGPIPLVIGIDDHGIIKEIVFQANSETPEFFKQVIDTGILNNWIGKDVPAAAKVEVDAVSGATMSSVGLSKTINKSLNAKLGIATESPVMTKAEWIKTLSISAVGIFALLSFFAPKRLKPFHLLLVTSSIFVLGIWHGSLLSVSKISAWLLDGVPDYVEIPLLLIFLASVLLPAFTGKNFYCYHLCPFGAAQDLMAKGIKVNIKVKLYKWLNHMRMVILMCCVLLLLFGVGASIANLEPFSAFKLEFAPITAICLFSAALLISTFIPRVWCRFFCPCGAFLDLFKGLLKRKKSRNKSACKPQVLKD